MRPAGSQGVYKPNPGDTDHSGLISLVPPLNKAKTDTQELKTLYLLMHHKIKKRHTNAAFCRVQSPATPAIPIQIALIKHTCLSIFYFLQRCHYLSLSISLSLFFFLNSSYKPLECYWV